MKRIFGKPEASSRSIVHVETAIEEIQRHYVTNQ
jgi:hypothetical protein